MQGKDPLAHAPILPLLRALGMPRRRLREGNRTRRQPERSQSRLVPGASEPPGGTGQNPCKKRKPEATASPRAMPRTAIRACRRTITGVRGCPHIAADTRAAMTAGSTAVCDQKTAEGAGCRVLGECSVWGARLTCRLLPARKLLDDNAQFAQACRDSASGIADVCGPRSPGSHRVVWGLTARPPVPLRAFLRFPVCPPGSPPSPAVPGFPSSGVLRFGPFGRCPVRVLRRFPPGFPSLSNLHVSAAAGRFRRLRSRAAGTKVTSPAATTSPGSRDRPHCRWAAAGHDGMPPQNRLLPAAASAGHRRARTAQGARDAARTATTQRDRRAASLRCVGRRDGAPVQIVSSGWPCWLAWLSTLTWPAGTGGSPQRR